MPVISESLDLVYFHELRVPIHVNTVPKCKLVFTKDLKNAAFNNKLGFLRDYDIRSKRIQVTLAEEDKTCLIKPENLSIDMETWPTDISKAAISAIEDMKSKCLWKRQKKGTTRAAAQRENRSVHARIVAAKRSKRQKHRRTDEGSNKEDEAPSNGC